MSRKVYIIVGLLAVSLLFNLITWNELQDLEDNQLRLQNRIFGLQNEISSVRGEVTELVDENRWIQESNFEIDRNNTDFYHAILQGQWTFKELQQDQTPYLMLKEEGGEWKEFKLEKLNGLTYGTDLELSTEKNYEYKITAKGPVAQSTDTRPVPYNLYGIPRVEVKFGMNRSTGDEVTFDFIAASHLNPPIKEMVPEQIFIEVQMSGKVMEEVKLSPSNKEDSIWEAKWTAENMGTLDDYTLFIVSEFSNGFTQREEVKQFSRRY